MLSPDGKGESAMEHDRFMNAENLVASRAGYNETYVVFSDNRIGSETAAAAARRADYVRLRGESET